MTFSSDSINMRSMVIRIIVKKLSSLQRLLRTTSANSQIYNSKYYQRWHYFAAEWHFVTLYAPDRAGERRGRRAKTPYRIVIKFCTMVGVPDLISHTKFGIHRFGGLGDSGMSNFIIFYWIAFTFAVVLKILWHF